MVVGGGPGGLACATMLAQQGARVVLAERKPAIGPKVCAGGITWHGLIKHVPAHLIEREFPEQVIVSPRQRIVVAEKNPIIATINRERLGQWMAEQAEAAGVTLLTGTRVAGLEHGKRRWNGRMGSVCISGLTHLVGADGSNSLVRRFLGLPTMAHGHWSQLYAPGEQPRMEWHLHPELFGSGYGWIFPHSAACSIGVYGRSPDIYRPDVETAAHPLGRTDRVSGLIRRPSAPVWSTLIFVEFALAGPGWSAMPQGWPQVSPAKASILL